MYVYQMYQPSDILFYKIIIFPFETLFKIHSCVYVCMVFVGNTHSDLVLVKRNELHELKI